MIEMPLGPPTRRSDRSGEGMGAVGLEESLQAVAKKAAAAASGRMNRLMSASEWGIRLAAVPGATSVVSLSRKLPGPSQAAVKRAARAKGSERCRPGESDGIEPRSYSNGMISERDRNGAPPVGTDPP